MLFMKISLNILRLFGYLAIFGCILHLLILTVMLVELGINSGETIAASEFPETINSEKAIIKSKLPGILDDYILRKSLVFLDTLVLASTSNDSTIKIWDISTTECIRILDEHKDIVTSLASNGYKVFASGSADKTVKLWEINRITTTHTTPSHNTFSFRLIKTLEGHSLLVNSVAFNSNGLLASGSMDMTVKLWNTTTGYCIGTLTKHSHPVNSIAFNNDGILAAGLINNDLRKSSYTIWIWNITTGECIDRIAPRKGIKTVAYSKKGVLASGGSIDNIIKLWFTSPDKVKTGVGHKKIVRSVAFSHDGKLLASGSDDGTVKVWDIDAYENLWSFEHVNPVECVAFNSLGVLASLSKDGLIKLWDTDNGINTKSFK